MPKFGQQNQTYMKRNLSLLAGLALSFVIPACSADDGPDTPGQKTVRISEVTNLTPEFLASVDGVEDGEELVPGDTLTITFSPGTVLSSGFSDVHPEHIHLHVADTVYMPVFPETDQQYVQSLSIDVIVPDEDFGIVAAYAVQQKLKEDGFTMALDSADDGVGLYGVSPDCKYRYFDCYLRVPDAYTVATVEFKVADGDWQDINSVSGCGCARSEVLDYVYDVKVRPNLKDVEGEVALRVIGSQHARYQIAWNNTDFISEEVPDGGQPNYLPTESIDGEKVVAWFRTKDGYYLAGAESDVEGLVPECASYAYVRFTMPASDVSIKLLFKEMATLKYLSSLNVPSAMIYDCPDIYYGVPVDKGIPGEDVYLFANCDNGFKPSKAVTEGGVRSDFRIYGAGADRYAWYAPVHIPEDASALTVSIETVKAYNVTGEPGIIFFKEGNVWAEGEKVPFQVYIPQGKTLAGVKAEQPDGTEITCTMDNTDGYFIMPASDVYVSASFSETNPGATAHISALYDADQYRVFSQTNPYYQRIDADGFDVPAGTALYISIVDDYGEPFWVGIKIGDSFNAYEVPQDEDTGEYVFNSSVVASGDVVIRAASTKDGVQIQ